MDFSNKLQNWRYGLLYRLNRGVSISISLTFRCNYKCHYCTMQIGGPMGKVKELTLDQWIDIIDRFPLKIKEVFISGGEPMLMPYTVDLINELVKRKILVCLFTNLITGNLFDIRRSPYFRINTTFHPQSHHSIKFLARYNELKRRGYQLTVDEVDTHTFRHYSVVKPMLTTVDELKEDNTRLRFAPDGTLHTTCYDLYQHGKQ